MFGNYEFLINTMAAISKPEQPPQVQTATAHMTDILGYWSNFGLEKLKNDLNTYTTELSAERSLHAGLEERLEAIQGILESKPKGVNSMATGMLETFQLQLNQLSNRVTLTESLIGKLVNFFSIIIATNEATQTLTQIQKSQPKLQANDSKPKPLAPLQASNLAFANANNITLNIPGGSTFIPRSTNYSDDQDASDSSFLQDENEEVPVKSTIQSLQAPQATYGLPYDLSNFKMPDETPEDVARRLKEFLITNKMSQKKFAESLLNMRQANFCTLLSQPANWPNLSKTCRERFQTIYLWLEDPDRMQKLDNCANKNLASLITYPSSSSITTSPTSNDEKRSRVFLNKTQSERLKTYFAMNPYPSSDEIETLSIELDLSAKRVANWFGNQRQIIKNTMKKSNSLM